MLNVEVKEETAGDLQGVAFTSSLFFLPLAFCFSSRPWDVRNPEGAGCWQEGTDRQRGPRSPVPLVPSQNKGRISFQIPS